MRLTRVVESMASRAARAVWPAARRLARTGRRTLQPEWAPAPLEKSGEKSMPILGWPRKTDSLCPGCVKQAREAILAGERDWRTLLEETPGEIEATILERDGKIVMEKSCPNHGDFRDVMAIDPEFLERIESLHPGDDFTTSETPLRNHGSSTIQKGRGAVLTVDLTNRCNMMCDACFMDANQVGYVHELTLEDVQKILDDSLGVKPRRQMSINFSGGEPTISPIFLDAVRYARDIGYFSIQASTNGIRFAQEPELAFAAREAGLRIAYLQFDGVHNEAHAHRRIANLFDVKQRAIDNLAAADVDVVLVPTIINTINNDQVGQILDFAVDNADKVTVVSFQPISFTGRDEEIDPETRRQRRYTLSHLARDVSDHNEEIHPRDDWYPLSALGPFSDLVDVLLGANAEFGSLKCGCHPNCGVGTVLFVNKETGEALPMSRILDLDQLMKDVQSIADACRGRTATLAQVGLALLKNFDAKSSPVPFSVLFRQFLSQTGAGDASAKDDADLYDWRVMFVAGMWFQDLFNYDFRRTERCIIPYGTQMGEISFCAYNTGVGWRKIVEEMHKVATVQDWYEEVGRHPVHANRKPLPLPEVDGGLVTLKVDGRPARTPSMDTVNGDAVAGPNGEPDVTVPGGSTNGATTGSNGHGAVPPRRAEAEYAPEAEGAAGTGLPGSKADPASG